jgi:hypothetical protein
MESSSKRIAVALTEVFMPCPLDAAFVGFYYYSEKPQRARIVSIIVGDAGFWVQPELRFAVVLLDVDVDGFARISFVGVKEEAEAAFSEDFGHGMSVCQFFRVRWGGRTVAIPTLSQSARKDGAPGIYDGGDSKDDAAELSGAEAL